MNKNNSATKLIAVSVVFAIFIGILLTLANLDKFKNYTDIAFYRIPEQQVKVISSELERLTDDNGKKIPYRFTVLNPETELSTQIKRNFDAVIALQGKSTLSAAEKVSDKKKESIFYTDQILQGFTISMSQTVQQNEAGLITAVPFLQDIYEADFYYNNDSQKNFSSGIETWNHLKSIASTAKGNSASPIIFAGSDNAMVIDLLGVLVESLEGKEAYLEKCRRTYEIFQENQWDLASVDPVHNKELKEMFSEELKIIMEWKNEGLISKEIWNYTQADVNSFMKNRPVAVAFMTLSAHRTVDQSAIQLYKSLPELSEETMTYFPSQIPTSRRSMITPVTAIVPLSQDKFVDYTIKHLLMPSVQESLGNRTGIAPVLASVNCGDIQSDDARFWVAATQPPLMPMSEEAFCDAMQRMCFVNVVFEDLK